MPPKQQPRVYSVGCVRIRKRPQSKYWLARYRDEAGEWVEQSLKVTNKDVAIKKAGDLSDLIERGDYGTIDARKSKRTFADLVDEFKQNYSGWTENTFRKNNGTLEKLKAEFGDQALAAISTRRLDEYLARRLDMGGIAMATRNRYVATLKTLFKCAIRWGYIGTDPVAPIKIQREQGNIPDALSMAQVEAVLSELPSISPKAVIVATIAADTGMRRSEIQRLEWADIDVEASALRGVHQTKSKEPRTIPLTPRLIELFAGLDRDDPDGLVIKFDNIKNALFTAGARCGVPRLGLHQFRHSFATHALDAGVPVERVQYLLGHASIAMTQRYDHPRPERHRAAMDLLWKSRQAAKENAGPE